MNDRGTILDRAIRIWKSSEFAFLEPSLAVEQPEAFRLAHRIATDYPGVFTRELFELLRDSNAIVVAHALEVIALANLASPSDIPSCLLKDERSVIVPGCLFRERSIGELARECQRRLARNL